MSYHDMSPRPLVPNAETGMPEFALTGDEARVAANWTDPVRGAPLAFWGAKDVQPLVRQDGPATPGTSPQKVLDLPFRGMAPDGTLYFAGAPKTGHLPTTFPVMVRTGQRGDTETAVAQPRKTSSLLTPRRVIYQG